MFKVLIIILSCVFHSIAIGGDQAFGLYPLEADDLDMDNIFGDSVAISGNLAAVGAPGNGDFGAVYIYELSGSDWVMAQKITVDDEVDLVGFGTKLSLSPGRLVVGAHKSDGQKGFVFVYEPTELGWQQTALLTADDAQFNDQFGRAIAHSGDTISVGAPWTDDLANLSGSVYVFDLVGGEWVQRIELQASDGGESDFFGLAVSIDNDRLVVGALGNDDMGAAYVFERDQGKWIEQQKLTINNSETFDRFGSSISVSEDHILIGAPGRSFEFNNQGAAYLFKLSESKWLQERTFFDVNGQQGEAFGSDVKVKGSRLLIGSNGSEILDVSDQKSWVYEFQSGVWNKLLSFTVDDDNNGIEDKLYGTRVDISGDQVIVGSIGFDDFIGGAFIYHIENIFISDFEFSK